MKYLSAFAALSLSFLVAGCLGPYIGSETPVTSVAINGDKFNVQRDPTNVNWWGSEYTPFVKATLNVVTRTNNHIAAIEKVSGCKVKRETVITLMAAVVGLNAEVEC